MSDPAVVLERLAAGVPGTDPDAAGAARQRQDRLAKPPGSLGAVEDLSVRLAGIAARCPPPVPDRPALLVAAADHGVHATGVSPWPQPLTADIAAAIARGDAAAGVLGDQAGVRTVVLDVGTVGGIAPGPQVVDRRVRAGTADLSAGPAMTPAEAAAAVTAGRRTAGELLDDGADLLVLGDVGLANTTAAACLVAAMTGAGPGAVVGRGSGADDDVLAAKRTAVAAALDRHDPAAGPAATLATLGGLEHAALVGAMLTAAARRVPVLLDGLAGGAAALVAASAAPRLPDHLVAGHRSTEPAARLALDELGLPPLLDLRLRLGEGSGALLAVPLVRAAARLLADMATIDELGDAHG